MMYAVVEIGVDCDELAEVIASQLLAVDGGLM